MALLRFENEVSFPFVRWEYATTDEPMQEVLPKQSYGERLVKTVGGRPLRSWVWPQDLTKAEKQSLEAFLIAVDWRRVAFLLKDPKDYEAAGTALTLVSGTTYALPTAIGDAASGHYPIDDANVQAYDGGSPVSHSAVDQEARTITLSVSPGGAVTADYHFERLVKLQEALPMQGQKIDWYRAAPMFVEIIDAV